MPRPEKGADQFEKIAEGNGKRCGDAEQIQPGCSEKSADPGPSTGPLPPEQAEQGNDDHVKSGDETGVSGGGVDQPHLLEGGAGKKGQTGQGPPAEQLPPGQRRPQCLGQRRRPAAFDHQRQQHQAAEGKPDPVEGKRPDMIHPHPLGHEGKPPDHGGQQKKAVGFQCSCVHDSGSVSYPAPAGPAGAFSSR